VTWLAVTISHYANDAAILCKLVQLFTSFCNFWNVHLFFYFACADGFSESWEVTLSCWWIGDWMLQALSQVHSAKYRAELSYCCCLAKSCESVSSRHPCVLWWVCLSVCLSVRSHISETTAPNFTIFACVACAPGSVHFWRRRATVYTSGFVDDVMFSHTCNGPVAHRVSMERDRRNSWYIASKFCSTMKPSKYSSFVHRGQSLISTIVLFNMWLIVFVLCCDSGFLAWWLSCSLKLDWFNLLCRFVVQ